MTAHEQWLPSASDQEDALARYDNDDRDPADDPRHLERVVELARTFPSLADNAILDAFDADVFDAWASGNDCTGQAFFAAQFVLQVVSAGEHWETGTFNAVLAMLAWDEAHRAAFLAWARAPWGGSR